MNQMHVVSRNAIDAIQTIEEGGKVHKLGELRDFRWSEELRTFMEDAKELSVSWVLLQEGEVLEPHVHPIHTMLVFYAGSGRLLGDMSSPLGMDDVVIVPAGCAHGFVGGPGGLYGLSIQFGEGLYTKPEAPRVAFTDSTRTLQGLLEYNQERIREFAERSIFQLLRDGTLEDPRKREVYMQTLQTWVDGNQSLLFTRQATCKDARFSSVFLTHMHEELGHDEMHKARPQGNAASDVARRDPVIEAIADWFTHQMYVLDNAEKAVIIHLVIENASATYHAAARPVLAKHMTDEYFDVHVEADGEHAAMGVDLLRSEAPESYARLREVVGEAWDMIGAMTDRVVECTRAIS